MKNEKFKGVEFEIISVDEEFKEIGRSIARCLVRQGWEQIQEREVKKLRSNPGVRNRWGQVK